MHESTSVVLKRYINHGQVSEDDFAIVTSELGADVAEGSVLLDLIYLSVDPYMRGRMKDQKGYFIGPFKIGEPIASSAIAVVRESNNPDLPVGTYVQGLLSWQTPQVVDAAQLRRVDNPTRFPLSYFLGDLGLTGWTAYASMKKIGKPKQGDVVFVSGAAGAVGSAAGQLAKHLWGCKVIGSAGTDAKVALLKNKLGFDAAFNYKNTSTDEALSQYAPEGINIYFDNVGGETLETAIEHCANHARIIASGAISGYDKPKEELYGVRNLFNVVTRRLTMQGFIVGDFPPETLAETVEVVSRLIKDGKFHVIEDVVEGGLPVAGGAFVGLMRGENVGKRVVQVGRDEFRV